MTRERLYKLRELIVKASSSLSDADALKGIELFDAWAADTEYPMGKRLRYEDKLYRVRQAHTSQVQYPPTIVPALYEEVAEPGQGDTPDNPIPYNNNMALEEGKYYSQYGVVYICFRDTGVAVYNDLSALVDLYVRVYEVSV